MNHYGHSKIITVYKYIKQQAYSGYMTNTINTDCATEQRHLCYN